MRLGHQAILSLNRSARHWDTDIDLRARVLSCPRTMCTNLLHSDLGLLYTGSSRPPSMAAWTPCRKGEPLGRSTAREPERLDDQVNHRLAFIDDVSYARDGRYDSYTSRRGMDNLCCRCLFRIQSWHPEGVGETHKGGEECHGKGLYHLHRHGRAGPVAQP
jgi:hypothetical protein